MKKTAFFVLALSLFFVQCSQNDPDPTPSPNQNEYIEFTFNGNQYRNDRDEDYAGLSLFSVVSGSSIILNQEYLSTSPSQPFTPFTYPEDIEFDLRLNNISNNMVVDCNGSNTGGNQFFVGDFAFGPWFGVHDACSGTSTNNVNSFVQFNFSSIPTTVGGFYVATFTGTLEGSNLSGEQPKTISGSLRIKRTS